MSSICRTVWNNYKGTLKSRPLTTTFLTLTLVDMFADYKDKGKFTVPEVSSISTMCASCGAYSLGLNMLEKFVFVKSGPVNLAVLRSFCMFSIPAAMLALSQCWLIIHEESNLRYVYPSIESISHRSLTISPFAYFGFIYMSPHLRLLYLVSIDHLYTRNYNTYTDYSASLRHLSVERIGSI